MDIIIGSILTVVGLAGIVYFGTRYFAILKGWQ